jgi:hypothetical protein
MRDIRLGDDIDDFCVRCKRVMNHAVVSVISAAPAKVRCRTCHSDHDYRHEQAPPPKVDARKAALFSEVLKKVDPGSTPGEVDLLAGSAVEVEVDLEGTEVAVAEEPPPVEEILDEDPKTKAKVKTAARAKGKARK